MKTTLKSLLILTLFMFGCSSDDGDDRPFCSEYNIQDPNADFVNCEDPESECKCG